MPEEKPKATICPNCQQPAIRTGNEIACEHCDAIFVVTQKQGAKLKTLGPIDDLRQRVERLESMVPGEQPEPEPEPKEREDEEGDEDDTL